MLPRNSAERSAIKVAANFFEKVSTAGVVE